MVPFEITPELIRQAEASPSWLPEVLRTVEGQREWTALVEAAGTIATARSMCKRRRNEQLIRKVPRNIAVEPTTLTMPAVSPGNIKKVVKARPGQKLMPLATGPVSLALEPHYTAKEIASRWKRD